MSRLKTFIKGNKILYPCAKFIKTRFFTHSQRPLNKLKLDCEIASFHGLGIEAHPAGNQVMISVTSFPARIHEVKYTIYSLLNQTYKLDQVVLWLGKDQFPNQDADLPADLLKLKDKGLTISFLIVTVDDDIYYPKFLLKKLMHEHYAHPDCIIAYRAHRIRFEGGQIRPYTQWEFATKDRIHTPSYLNFFTGVGGVLYDAKLLYKDILREDLFMRYCPRADDVWFNAMAVLQGTKTKIVKGGAYPLQYVNPENEEEGINTLSSYNNGQGGNDLQIQAVLKLYPEILPKLLNDELSENEGGINSTRNRVLTCPQPYRWIAIRQAA